MARMVIVGGSLGGLMVANLLHRAGHHVTVLEKAVGPMDGRGAGIVIQPALVAGLKRCGLQSDDELGVQVQERVTLDDQGRELGRTPQLQTLTSWSRLYQMLHQWLPSSCYRQGMTVSRVDPTPDGVCVQTPEGTLEADIVIAADGFRSAVRAQLWPRIQPEYAGYVAWRGVCDEALLSQRTLSTAFGYFGFCLPPGEQLIGYPVAGPGNRTEAGHRGYNFVWYRPAPAPQGLRHLLTDADGVHHPLGIPPHKVSWLNVADMRADARRLLAPQFAEMIEKTALPFLQPIYDLVSAELVHGRVALIGDAAFVARPHVGAGVTKAMQDAVAVADAIAAHGATPQALLAYQQARLTVGQHVVARGRRLGQYMQSCGQQGQPVESRDATTVMAETAIDLDRLPPEPYPAAPTLQP